MSQAANSTVVLKSIFSSCAIFSKNLYIPRCCHVRHFGPLELEDEERWSSLLKADLCVGIWAWYLSGPWTWSLGSSERSTGPPKSVLCISWWIRPSSPWRWGWRSPHKACFQRRAHLRSRTDIPSSELHIMPDQHLRNYNHSRELNSIHQVCQEGWKQGNLLKNFSLKCLETSA